MAQWAWRCFCEAIEAAGESLTDRPFEDLIAAIQLLPPVEVVAALDDEALLECASVAMQLNNAVAAASLYAQAFVSRPHLQESDHFMLCSELVAKNCKSDLQAAIAGGAAITATAIQTAMQHKPPAVSDDSISAVSASKRARHSEAPTGAGAVYEVSSSQAAGIRISSVDIASDVLWKLTERGADHDFVRTHKAMYLVDAVWAHRHASTIIAEDSEAWDYGPVYPIVQQKLCALKSLQTVTPTPCDPGPWCAEVEAVVSDVVNFVVSMSASELVELIQCEGPWLMQKKCGKISEATIVHWYYEMDDPHKLVERISGKDVPRESCHPSSSVDVNT